MINIFHHPNFIQEHVKNDNSNMPFSRNEFSNIFKDRLTMA